VNKEAFAQKHLMSRSGLSYLLWPASLAYASYMFVRRRLLSGKGYKSTCKVISVGNLSMGGSGKTPVSIALALALKERGMKVLYSSRGYKSAIEEGATLISDGTLERISPKAGDEAIEAARALLGIPVICGRDRQRTLHFAENLEIDTVILDDAFQHLKVQRDIDILVFDSETGLGNGFLIPAGYLRENLSAIDKDCIIIFHHKPMNEPNLKLKQKLQERTDAFFEVHSTNDSIIHKGEEIDPVSLQDKRITLLCGIADPRSFKRGAQALGISWQNEMLFADHQDFSSDEIRDQIRARDADYILCTAKDAVKLLPEFEDKLIILQLRTYLPESLLNFILYKLN
jgi:tetraacyldisaccharide 4'-kinase